jgi:hypothetical protein
MAQEQLLSETKVTTIDLIGLYIPFDRSMRESICVGFEFGVFEDGELKHSHKIAYDDTFKRIVKKQDGSNVTEEYQAIAGYNTADVYVDGVQQFEQDGVTPITTQEPIYETQTRNVMIGEREHWEQMLGRNYIWPPSERTITGIKNAIMAQIGMGKTLLQSCNELEAFIKSQQ